MRWISAIVLALGIASCKSPDDGGPAVQLLSTKPLTSLAPGKNRFMIISCTRCGYYNGMLTNVKPEQVSLLKDITIMADSACTRTNLPVLQLKQKEIDAISMDFYNIILLKKEGKDWKCRVIRTEESPKTFEIAERFFRA